MTLALGRFFSAAFTTSSLARPKLLPKRLQDALEGSGRWAINYAS
jgi:hypothetical protein